MRKIIVMLGLLSCLFSPAVTADKQKEAIKKLMAMYINVNGFLCAQVTDIRQLKVGPNFWEVTCIEYGGGSAKKTYIFDSKTGRAWVP